MRLCRWTEVDTFYSRKVQKFVASDNKSVQFSPLVLRWPYSSSQMAESPEPNQLRGWLQTCFWRNVGTAENYFEKQKVAIWSCSHLVSVATCHWKVLAHVGFGGADHFVAFISFIYQRVVFCSVSVPLWGLNVSSCSEIPKRETFSNNKWGARVAVATSLAESWHWPVLVRWLRSASGDYYSDSANIFNSDAALQFAQVDVFSPSGSEQYCSTRKRNIADGRALCVYTLLHMQTV